MKIAITAIVLRQFISEKSGNATLTLFDLDTNREVNITLRDGALQLTDGRDLTPRSLILDGVETFKGDRGLYMTCSSVNTAPTGRAEKATA